MPKRLLLIINSRSGRGHIKSSLSYIENAFSEAGFLIDTYFTESSPSTRAYVSSRGRDYDLIVCAGGDGTLSDTMSGCASFGGSPAIGYIPCGTTNDMASSFSLSRDIEKAVARILSGTPHPFDLGRFEDHTFSYVHAFGAFTDVSFQTPQKSKRALGHFAYLLGGMLSLGKIHRVKSKVELNGETVEDDFIFGSVSSSASVAGVMKLPENEVAYSDGLFEVLLIRFPKNVFETVNIVSQMLRRKYDQKLVRFTHAKNVRFTFDRPVTWTRDGENGGTWTACEAECLPNAISLMM